MPKKKQPYYEIINIQKELNEYKKLCKNKSKKFKYYLDWKHYMKPMLERLDDDVKISNFKHYIINMKRTENNLNQVYVAIILFAYTSLITFVKMDLNIISGAFLIMVLLFMALLSHDDYNKDCCFFSDVIEIIEEIEKERENNLS